MKKSFTLLFAVLLAFVAAWADEPFRKHRYDLFKAIPPAEGSIVFVGNSITDMHPWVESFRGDEGALPIVNRGNSGTYSTEQSANLESYLVNKPEKFFMMIGTNDIATSGGLNFEPAQVLAYVKSIVKRVHKRSPETQVYLYSILNNNTSNRPAERWLETNRLVKAFVDETNEDWLNYIDLYDLLTDVASGGVWSYDGLHLTAASYQKWCEAFYERGLLLGNWGTVHPTYPSNASSSQQDGGLTGSHGMRATYFSLLPITSEDILFFGDEEVKNGEWNELFGNPHFKNRGSGWGYGGLSLTNMKKLVEATFARTEVDKLQPKAVLLYAGTSEANGSDDLETVKLNYIRVIEAIMAEAPEARIFLIGLHPTNNATINTSRIAVLNEYLSTLGPDKVKYIDCYTPFLNGDVADTKYIKNTNYLYGLGYVKMANIIKDALITYFPDETFNVLTEEAAAENIIQAERRNAIGQALTAGDIVPLGEGMGQYGEAGMAAFNAKAEEAYELLTHASISETEATNMANALRTALAEAINLPAESTEGNEHWYQLHSLRSPDYYVSASAAGAAGVVGSNSTATSAASMWKFVKRTDGAFDIVNRRYGTYLSPSAAYDSQIQTATTQPSAGWTLSYANTQGYYIISSGTVQLNQTQAGLSYKIYNWSSESSLGSDRSDTGCQFLIEDAPDPDEPAAELTYTIDKLHGSLYNGTTENAAYNSVWKSSATPQLTFTANANNMNWKDNNVQLFSGSSANATYTLAAPAGYVIDSYSFSFANNGHSTGLTIAITGGPSYTTSTTAQTHSQTGLSESSVAFTLSGTNLQGVVLSDFTVKIKVAEALSLPTISTEGDVHWYYITNASTKAYCTGKVMYYDSAIDRMRFGDKAFSSDRVWSFWQQDGKLAIKNYDGVYVGTAGSGTGSSTQFGKSDTPNYIYTISEAYDYYIIKDTATELHAQEAGAVIVRWAAAADGASLWKFEKVDMSHPEATVASTTVKQGKVTTGIGNKNQPIVRAAIRVNGVEGSNALQAVKGRVIATDKADVAAVKVYIASNDRELFVDEDNLMAWREGNGTLFGTTTDVADDGTFTVTGTHALTPGENYVWIAYDIAETAAEGHTVDAAITAYTIDGADRAEANGNPNHAVTIFLSESAVLMPYDCGSRYYRIPAITTVKKKLADGRIVDRLVTLTDDRLQHNGDLPNQVYVVAQYSDDLGKSWTQPVRVAGTAELGGAYGHGDASLVTDRTTGNIIGIMTSAGTYGHGFWASTAAQPMLWKTIVSEDGGETWGTPVDHTKSLYGTGSPNPTWKGGFSGSGAALQKRDGTLVSSFVNRQADNSQNFFFFMSFDHGQTWSVQGTSGTTSADEPKTLERNNGDLSIFVRATGYNFHNVTSDNGKTWHYAPQTRFTSGISGVACDGEYMTWCSTLDGNPWNIALETLPNSSTARTNVSICLSTDEGETFGSPKTICPWGSGYSTAVVLPDGTLGVYYEEDGYYNASNYVLRFVRMSLDWASDGRYKFTEEQPFYPIPSEYTPTGIHFAPAPSLPANDAIYDLSGRRVSDTAIPGVYIKNGRKVIVK